MKASGKLQEHLEKLRVLNFIGKSGSITKAAALLRITQAAASHSIRVLEQILDLKLLHREARGIRLTDSGKILFEFSERLFADIQSVEARTLNPYHPDAGVLRIGTHETLAIHVWPKFLQQFGERHPKVSVSLTCGRIDGLIKGLLSRDFQIVMSVEPLKHRDIRCEAIYEGSMGLFVANRPEGKPHPLVGRKSLSLSEANEVPIITDALAHIRQNLSIPVFLMDHGFTLDRFYELNSFEAAMRLAMTGMGIAVVPERNAHAYVKDGLLRPLKIEGLNLTKFGHHRICASVLKEEAKYQPVTRIFFEELMADFKKIDIR